MTVKPSDGLPKRLAKVGLALVGFGETLCHQGRMGGM